MPCPFQNRPWTTGLTSAAAITAVAVMLNTAIQAVGAAGAGTDETTRHTQRISLPKQHLTIYSGRSESLVGDLITRFEDETGIEVKVKYAGTGPLAAMILEEGQRSPADVFFAQDPGGLGVLAEAERLGELPLDLLERVGYQYRDPHGRWVGVTGRLRVMAYSTTRLTPAELPASARELTDPIWAGRVGWAPSNASFQAFITAMRHQDGERATERWLRDMLANNPRTYANNTSILQGIADGEIDLGLANHYYAHRMSAERGGEFPVANHVPAGAESDGDICGAMLVSGAAILNTCANREAAERFLEFLLSESSQQYFASKTFEYPLATADEAQPLNQLTVHRVDLNQLGDLRETVSMLRRVGALR